MTPAEEPSPEPLRRRSRTAGFGAATIVLATSAWLASAVLAPRIGLLQADQRLVTLSTTSAEFRDRPDASPRQRSLIARRTDQVLLVSGETAIVQGSFDWIAAGGRETLLESSGLFGVDRRTRANLAGYGDRERHGQYGFPAPAPRANLTVWDPNFRAPWTAHFEQVDNLQGLEAYRYRLEVPAHDDTPAFAGLPGVPERWRIETEAAGELWVEPVSGLVLERSVRGKSWFITADGRARVSEALSWRAQFASETRQQQSEAAARERTWRLAAGRWWPRVAVLLACLCLLLAVREALLRRRRA